MSSKMAEAIKQLIQDRGISEELVHKTIEELLLAAYKKKYGAVDNAVVRFSEDGSEVTIFAQKKIVEEVEDSLREIALQEALEYNEECEIGDELLIEVNPQEFDRGAVQSAKQKAKQTLREIQKNTLFSEFKEKVGEMIIGYYQRERNGNIYVDLGKTEGILPKKYQSPREIYHPNDRVRALIYEVNKTAAGLQIVLSRTHTDFVKRIFELEVPEVYDRTIEIFKLVREPGYRTKMAVYSNREDVDPVGACVGLKGVRIQAVVREMEGEKIDVLKYDPDPRGFIKNALSPAQVEQVVLLDEAKKQAMAIVEESQFSLAIGKQGLNVRLANRLVDWNIDVKTEKQFEEMDLSADTKRAVSALFGEIEEEEEIVKIDELPGIPDRLVEALRQSGIEYIESLVSMEQGDFAALEGVSEEDARLLKEIIEKNIEIIEEEAQETEEQAPRGTGESLTGAPKEDEAPTGGGEDTAPAGEAGPGDQAEEIPGKEVLPAGGSEKAAEASSLQAAPEMKTEVPETGEEEEIYECPECGGAINTTMASCPNCGVGLSFEEE